MGGRVRVTIAAAKLPWLPITAPISNENYALQQPAIRWRKHAEGFSLEYYVGPHWVEAQCFMETPVAINEKHPDS